MRLIDLLQGFAVTDDELTVNKLTLDSREVRQGDVFIALSGTRQHGMSFAQQAVKNGASAIIYDPEGCHEHYLQNLNGVRLVAVDQLSKKLGEIAARFYRVPSAQLSVIGITGTNGKTSCSQFLAQVLPDSAIIGTLGWGTWGQLEKTINTTPDALSIQAILAMFVQQNKKHVVMEVSSHGIEQGRVKAVDFDLVVYTNISRDHLDYHGSMQAYLTAKLKLLATPGLKKAVINIDDHYSEQITAAIPESVEVWGFSLKGRKDTNITCVRVKNIEYHANGTEFDVVWADEAVHMNTALYGDFNIENLLTVLTVLLAMGYPLLKAAGKVAQVKPIPGRMQRFGGNAEPVIFVDYAHTPDALNNVLSSIRKYVSQAVWVVFGCGGDRDTGKRSEMGRIAESWADYVVLTNDNPRTEDADQIIKDILQGCQSDKVVVIKDRERAINKVVKQAGVNDWIVVAGKGHEQYQEVGHEKFPFSDQKVIVTALAERKAAHENDA